MRPVVYYNASRAKHFTTEENDQLEFAVAELLHACEMSMMVPGHVEQWTVVVDLSDIGYTEIAVSNIKNFVIVSQKLFKNYNVKTYMINAGWLVKKGYDVLSVFLEPIVRNKQVFLGSDYK
jgi:Na+/alanine symporter